MSCCKLSRLETLSAALVQGASLELRLTPKPGLVDRADAGSHPDLSFELMERSIGYLAHYLDAIVASLSAGQPFRCQQEIAIRTERRLLQELGTNTHKGYVFLSGMLLIARWRAASSDEKAVRRSLSALAEDFFKSGEERSTHGGQAREKYRAGGIVRESIRGFPAVFEEALPAYRAAMRSDGCFIRASFAMLARLMQTVEDTTTLHRAGPAGLALVKREGRRLEQIVASGGDHVAYLSALNDSFIRMNLTMGGIADMLGISYGYLIAQGEISEDSFIYQSERSRSRSQPGTAIPIRSPIFID